MSKCEILRAKIIDLMSKLSSNYSDIGDWKLMKIQEALLTGEDVPYDINELRIKRQAVRAEINRLQDELKEAELQEQG